MRKLSDSFPHGNVVPQKVDMLAPTSLIARMVFSRRRDAEPAMHRQLPSSGCYSESYCSLPTHLWRSTSRSPSRLLHAQDAGTATGVTANHRVPHWKIHVSECACGRIRRSIAATSRAFLSSAHSGYRLLRFSRQPQGAGRQTEPHKIGLESPGVSWLFD